MLSFTLTFAPHNIGIFGASLFLKPELTINSMHDQLFFSLGKEVDKLPFKVSLTNGIPNTSLTPIFPGRTIEKPGLEKT